MLSLIAGLVIGAAGALAYSNRSALIKDVDTAYEDAMTDLGTLEARLSSTASRASAASSAHSALASANAIASQKASAAASSIAAVTGSKTTVTTQKT